MTRKMTPITPSDLSSFPSLFDVSIEQLQHGLSSGLFTSTDLVRAYTARINQVNHVVRAIMSVCPDALDAAAALDAERERGSVRGPLHGIPVVLKDNMAVASSDPDVPSVTAGSFALAHATVDRDAAVVASLRAAGAVLLAKANMNEWSGWRVTNYDLINGWSAIAGQGFGAHAPRQTPLGSSGGSATAVDLGLCPVSLGTDTGGSVMLPAAYNNIVGIRPTTGLVSRDLVVPVSLRRDSVGVLGRTVKDAAAVLSVIVGQGPGADDHAGDKVPEGILPYAGPAFPRDYLSACNANALAGARIGVPKIVIDRTCARDPRFVPQVAAFYSLLPVLQDAGATLVDTHFSSAEAWADDDDADNMGTYMTDLASCFWDDLPAYIAQLTTNPVGIRTVRELDAWTKSHGDEEEFPHRDTNAWSITDYGKDDPRAKQARLDNDDFAGPGALLGAIARDKLDAVVMPSEFGCLWVARIGAAGVVVPMGRYGVEVGDVANPDGPKNRVAPGIPFGMLFMGKHWSEERLIGLAYAFEQRTKIRDQVTPFIKPTIELRDLTTTR